jgi:hypothetical protein
LVLRKIFDDGFINESISQAIPGIISAERLTSVEKIESSVHRELTLRWSGKRGGRVASL